MPYDEAKNQRVIEFAYLNKNEMCNIVITFPSGDSRKYTIKFDYNPPFRHIQYQTDDVDLFREMKRIAP